MFFSNLSNVVLNELGESCHFLPSAIEDVYPCTPIQLGLMADSLHDAGIYVYQDVFSLDRTIDLDRFCHAIDRVCSLNAILRTRIVDNSSLGLVQVVIAADQSPTSERPSDISVWQYLQQKSTRVMGLGNALWRSVIIDNHWIVTTHHAVTDSSSGKALAKDVASIYKGLTPETRAPYGHFAEYCSRIDPSAAKEFWSSRFSDLCSIFPRPLGSSSQESQTVRKKVQLSSAGKSISIALLPSYIEVAWALTVKAYTGDTEIGFGVVYSGRSSMPEGLETTLGPTLTTVPLQVSIQPRATVRDLLKVRSQQRRQLQSSPAMQYGLHAIRLSSTAAGAASKFQTVLNLIFDQNTEPLGSGLFKFEYTHSVSSPYSLMMIMNLSSSQMNLEALYKSAVLNHEEMERILVQFEHTLHWLIAANTGAVVDDLPSVNNKDRTEIGAWNDVSLPPHVASTIDVEFAKVVCRQPDDLAVDAEDKTLTYRELEARTNILARELVRRGVQLEDKVPIIFEKSAWAVVALLAILKAGGSCVPIDPDHPAERKQRIFEITNAKLVLASATYYPMAIQLRQNSLAVNDELLSLLEHYPDHFQGCSAPSHSAYVLFTSGSTGLPKGVVLEHHSLLCSLWKLMDHLTMTPGLKVLQFAAYIWDISLLEIFGALLSGSCLCIPSEEVRRGNLARFINVKNVEWMILTPTVLRTLAPAEVPHVHTVTCAGEPVDRLAHAQWGKGRRFHNAWGPTEGSIANTVARLRPDSMFPETIGTAINCAIWIVNPQTLDLVPIGAMGEILIEGPTVAQGYLNQTGATAFIAPPRWATIHNTRRNTKNRFYRTGDLGKYNWDGSICYLGRSDHQVKLRGQRFELGEVENVLMSCKLVRNVLVTIHEGNGSDWSGEISRESSINKQLAAVISLTNEELPSEGLLQELPDHHLGLVARELAEIKALVQSRLPTFMLPSLWIIVQRLPRSMTDKLDRNTICEWLRQKNDLLSVKGTSLAMGEEPETPESEAEKALQHVWSSVLHLSKELIGRQHSFITLGGDSISAMQVVHRCREKGIQVTIADLLRSKSLSDIAQLSYSASLSKTVGPIDGTSELQSAGSHVGLDEKSSISFRSLNGVSENTSLGLKVQFEAEALEKRRDSVFPGASEYEITAPAYDIQALMVASGEVGGGGFYSEFLIKPAQNLLDLAKLQSACESVIQHCAILRTTFVLSGCSLHQAVRYHVRGSQVTVGTRNDMQEISVSSHLAHFCLIPSQDGSDSCTEIRLAIHHALYDAWSLGIILRELGAAYLGHPQTPSPTYQQWSSDQASLAEAEKSTAKAYWKRLLKSSRMSYLGSTPTTLHHGRASATVRTEVPLEALRVPNETSANIFKSAWALLLGCASGTDDVVFTEVNANRNDTSSESYLVCGPCATLVPLRARLNQELRVGELIEQIREQCLLGLPYLHVPTREIVKECTEWPSWASFGSILTFQNHKSLSSTFNLAEGVPCTLTAEGTASELAQIWVTAVPGPRTVAIDITYSPSRIAEDQAKWVSDCLTYILSHLHSRLDHTVQAFQHEVSSQPFGAYRLPATTKSLNNPAQARPLSPSPRAREIVSKAWTSLGFRIPENKNNNNNTQTLYAAHRVDIVDFYLLAAHLKSQGVDLSAAELALDPSPETLAALIDAKLPASPSSLAP